MSKGHELYLYSWRDLTVNPFCNLICVRDETGGRSVMVYEGRDSRKVGNGLWGKRFEEGRLWFIWGKRPKECRLWFIWKKRLEEGRLWFMRDETRGRWVMIYEGRDSRKVGHGLYEGTDPRNVGSSLFNGWNSIVVMAASVIYFSYLNVVCFELSLLRFSVTS